MYVNIVPNRNRRSRKRWHLALVGENHETMLTSQGYVSLYNARRAAAHVFPGLPVTIARP